MDEVGGRAVRCVGRRARTGLLLLVALLAGLPSMPGGIPVLSREKAGRVYAGERPPSHAPVFVLPDLDGRTRALEEFLGANHILLEFMSLDCPHCRDMAPILARLHAAYGKRIQFLTVAFERNPRRVRVFAEQEKHAWPYLLGNQTTIDAYRLEGVPTFFLVTPDGRIAAFRVGSTGYEAMSRAIETVLGRR